MAVAVVGAMPFAWGGVENPSPSLSHPAAACAQAMELRVPMNCFHDLLLGGAVDPWQTNIDRIASCETWACSAIWDSWNVSGSAVVATLQPVHRLTSVGHDVHQVDPYIAPMTAHKDPRSEPAANAFSCK